MTLHVNHTRLTEKEVVEHDAPIRGRCKCGRFVSGREVEWGFQEWYGWQPFEVRGTCSRCGPVRFWPLYGWADDE